MKILKSFFCITVFSFILPFFGQLTEAAQLSPGSTGQDVSKVQTILKGLGYLNSDPTGYYGPLTENAVIRFQKDFQIDPLGIIGPKTANKLDDINLMAHVVYGEARGENYEGQVAVAGVILNRVESHEFPNTVSQVVFQKNAFSSVEDGQFFLSPDSQSYQAVKEALLGWDPSNGSVYYYNPAITQDKWILTRKVTKKIGNHLFGIN